MRLGRWRDELESKSPVRRAEGEEKLSAVRDPAAAASIEKAFSDAEPRIGLIAVLALAAINDSRSTDALVRRA